MREGLNKNKTQNKTKQCLIAKRRKMKKMTKFLVILLFIFHLRITEVFFLPAMISELYFLVIMFYYIVFIHFYFYYFFSLDWMAITSLAVKKKARGRGIASSLLRLALWFAGRDPQQKKKGEGERGRERMRRRKVRLYVSVENEGAQKLYTKFGFECVKWLVGYYVEEGEDAVEMRLI